MNRFFAPILVTLLLAGCTNPSQPPKCDPFFGRTVIPPPPTGSATGRCADPYYPTPPVVQMPAQTPSQSPGCVPAAPATTAPPPMAAPAWTTPPPASAAPNTALPPSSSAPPGIVPNAYGPRPTSTGSSTAAPSASGANYRGVSLQGSRPVGSAQPYQQPPSSTGTSAGSVGGSLDDRTPRPIDNTGGDGRTAPATPIARTLPPRGSDVARDRPVVEIGDLPKNP
jgi:hypothetical protein